MTRTFQFSSPTNNPNPLFLKLKERFIGDDRPVGDILRQRIEKSGTRADAQPYAERDTAAEHRVTRANFLPHEHGESSSRAMRSFESTVFVNKQFRTQATLKPPVRKKSGFPARAILIVVGCFAILMLLIYSGMQINKLNREINELKTEVAEKQKSNESLAEAVERRIDLPNIEKTALTSLQMVKSTNTTVDRQYVDVTSGDTVILP